MGQVQERLVLTDDFTAAFTRFLNLGESAVRTAGDVTAVLSRWDVRQMTLQRQDFQ